MVMDGVQRIRWGRDYCRRPHLSPSSVKERKRKTLLGFHEEEKRVMGVVQDIMLSLDYCQLSLSTSNEIVHLRSFLVKFKSKLYLSLIFQITSLPKMEKYQPSQNGKIPGYLNAR